MTEKKIESDQTLQMKPSQIIQLDKQQQKIKKTFKFYLGSRQRYIVFSSDFDSGNIEIVKQLSQFQYRLGSVPDNYATKYQGNTKSWFYFSVTGFPKDTKGRFYIEKLQTLYSIYHSKYQNSYRPVYKIGQEGIWYRLPTQANLFMRQNQTLQLCFQYTFRKENEVVFFAFCYPFTYTQNLKYIQSLGDNLYIDEFYYHQQVLTFSPEQRFIHLLTITSYDQKNQQKEHEEIFDDKLFPEKNRPLRFNKPVILVTARVHPGETPASYALLGLVNFLTNKKDLRAFLLRKMFVFMIVPMINVDGVFNGHFRMDTYGQNLNRHYLNPDFEKQPAIYGIKKLAQHLNQDRRLTFYFDLHAHNAKKGCFIYGNAINDFVDQVQSQVFCKLFSMNTKSFQYEYCNFSLKHMKAKDRFQNLTKQGCGRVVMHKLTGIIHSYSLQCGLVSSNELNILSDPVNVDFKVGQLEFVQDQMEDNNNKIFTGPEPPLYTPQMYENVGKALLISILDTFDKNPYSRVYLSECKSMNMLRRMTAFEVFHQAERFRMFQRFTFHKVKNINELMQDNFKIKFNYKKIFNLNDNPILKEVEWPANIIGLKKQEAHKMSTSIQKRKVMKRQQNLYTGTSAQQQIDNEIYTDFLIKIKQVQTQKPQSDKFLGTIGGTSQNQKSEGQIQYRKRQYSTTKPHQFMEQALLDDGYTIKGDQESALSVRVRKLFKSQLRKQLKDSIKNEIKQQMSQMKNKLKHQIKSQIKHELFADEQSDQLNSPVQFKQKRNQVIHSKYSKKNLPNLTIQNNVSLKQSIVINNIVVPERISKRNTIDQYPTKRDFRVQSQKKRQSQKKLDIQKKFLDRNNVKLQMIEEGIKSLEEKNNESKNLMSNSKTKLSKFDIISRNNSKDVNSDLQLQAQKNNKKYKNQLITAKLRQYKRTSSKFPQILSQKQKDRQKDKQKDKQKQRFDRVYPYSSGGTFVIQMQTRTDLNDILKNTLKFEALRMKDMIKNISKSRN